MQNRTLTAVSRRFSPRFYGTVGTIWHDSVVYDFTPRFYTLGDNERVDAAVRAAEEESENIETPSMGMIYHFNAVAALGMVNEKWLRGEWPALMTMGFEIGDEGKENFEFKNAQSEELLGQSICMQFPRNSCRGTHRGAEKR